MMGKSFFFESYLTIKRKHLIYRIKETSKNYFVHQSLETAKKSDIPRLPLVFVSKRLTATEKMFPFSDVSN